jgi:hypothetical protein
LNPGRRGGKPASNRLSYGAAYVSLRRLNFLFHLFAILFFAFVIYVLTLLALRLFLFSIIIVIVILFLNLPIPLH